MDILMKSVDNSVKFSDENAQLSPDIGTNLQVEIGVPRWSVATFFRLRKYEVRFTPTKNLTLPSCSQFEESEMLLSCPPQQAPNVHDLPSIIIIKILAMHKR